MSPLDESAGQDKHRLLATVVLAGYVTATVLLWTGPRLAATAVVAVTTALGGILAYRTVVETE